MFLTVRDSSSGPLKRLPTCRRYHKANPAMRFRPVAPFYVSTAFSSFSSDSTSLSSIYSAFYSPASSSFHSSPGSKTRTDPKGASMTADEFASKAASAENDDVVAEEQRLANLAFAPGAGDASRNGSLVPFYHSRASNLLIPTLKDAPQDAVMASHKLLVRAGFIRPLSAGHFMMLPLAKRVLQKIENIVDEELGMINCQKLDMPMLMPAQIWKKTGRWESIGAEMMRFKDRHAHDVCLGPTHEEAFTHLVAQEIKSFKQLPLRLYQIGRKFRDEFRPRAGLLRAREFVMKDLYSFDVTKDGAHECYEEVMGAYKKIFERLGLPAVSVDADTGAIGGSLSHEFHVVSEAGEDTLLKCTICSYAANQEKATGALASDKFDFHVQSKLVQSGVVTDTMRCDPRSVGLWDADKVSKDTLIVEQETAVRSRCTAVVADLIPSGCKKDAPMIANVILVNEDNKIPENVSGDKIQKGGGQGVPVLPAKKEYMVVVLLRADRELNPISVKSFLCADSLRVLRADEAAIALLKWRQIMKKLGKEYSHQVASSTAQRVDDEHMSRLENAGRAGEADRQLEENTKKSFTENEGLQVLVDSSVLPLHQDMDLPETLSDMQTLPSLEEKAGQQANAEASKTALENEQEAKYKKKNKLAVLSREKMETLDSIGRLTSAEEEQDFNVDSLQPDNWDSSSVEVVNDPIHGDFTLAKDGDRCIQSDCRGHGRLQAFKGIEVGHVFYLGTKYSKPMEAKVRTPEGDVPIEMGCYGLGLSRIMAAAIESRGGFDKDGIVWPISISPFSVYLTAIGRPSSSTSSSSGKTAGEGTDVVIGQAEHLSILLQQIPGLRNDVLLDDRYDVGIGSRLKDAMLCGFPYIVIVGRTFRSENKVEVIHRASGEKQLMSVDALCALFAPQDPPEKKRTSLHQKVDAMLKRMEKA